LRKIHYISGIAIFLLCIQACNNNSRKQSANNSIRELTDEQLLDSIQLSTFRYFWDGAEPNSGMARERFHVNGVYPQDDKHIVTSGGSGFGIMALVVGIERGFINREQGMERFGRIMNFLESADRFHGVCPHWWDGETGKMKPFSEKDNGGDLVETSYLVQGLLTLRQYLNLQDEEEKSLHKRISLFIDEVEWTWHEKNHVLLWHWSPEYDFEMNHEIRGYNECLITYILAASSENYAISPETYHKGWARDGNIIGEHTKYGFSLQFDHNGSKEFGGPLFWAHYSFLGLDPRNLADRYADYWQENVNHTMINYSYCVDNPHNFAGYGKDCWGLTASYSINRKALEAPETDRKRLANQLLPGYMAHSPSNDVGVISPTAALSSFPYSPEQSLRAARFFYNTLGDKLVGMYGTYDAFSIQYDWYPERYLAIDQGPIVVMIENYRTGLLWDLFMQNEEISRGLERLGFTQMKE